jgi:hypothetical protein
MDQEIEHVALGETIQIVTQVIELVVLYEQVILPLPPWIDV